MTIDDLTKELKKVKNRHGNIRIYIEVGEEVKCTECGEPRTHIHDGFPQHAGTINVNQTTFFYIMATQDA